MAANQTEPRTPRPFLGIVFECCNAYSRAYLNRGGTAFIGRCPRCRKHACVNVSQQGSSDRFLKVS